MMTSANRISIAREELKISVDIPLRFVNHAPQNPIASWYGEFIVDWRQFGGLDMSTAVIRDNDEQALFALCLLLDDPDRYDEGARALGHLVYDGVLNRNQLTSVTAALSAVLKRRPGIRDDSMIALLIDLLQDR